MTSWSLVLSDLSCEQEAGYMWPNSLIQWYSLSWWVSFSFQASDSAQTHTHAHPPTHTHTSRVDACWEAFVVYWVPAGSVSVCVFSEHNFLCVCVKKQKKLWGQAEAVIKPSALTAFMIQSKYNRQHCDQITTGYQPKQIWPPSSRLICISCHVTAVDAALWLAGFWYYLSRVTFN